MAIQGQTKVKEALAVSVAQNIPVLIVGETGCGKTSIIRELAAKHKRKFTRFNMTGETSVDDFVGKYTLLDGKTVWQDGLLLQAMKTGAWLVVDEINVALPEILLVMNSLLDDDKTVTVASHDGEVVACHENFRFFGTMNPTDEYAGTKELNKAFLSRFGMVLEMSYPPKATETSILKNAGVAENDAKRMVDLAIHIRKLKKDGKVFYTCSTRDLLHWGELLSHMDMQHAFEVSVMNKATNDAYEMKQAYKYVLGEYAEVERLQEGLDVTELKDRLKNLADREANAEYQKERFERFHKQVEEDRVNLKKREAELEKVVREEFRAKAADRMRTALDYLGGTE